MDARRPEQTDYRWKVKYGGKGSQGDAGAETGRGRERRLKQIIAEQALDTQALKAVIARRW